MNPAGAKSGRGIRWQRQHRRPPPVVEELCLPEPCAVLEESLRKRGTLPGRVVGVAEC